MSEGSLFLRADAARAAMAAAGYTTYADPVARAGADAYAERLVLSILDAEKDADLDAGVSSVVYRKVRATMDRFHALDQRGRVVTFAPRNGVKGSLLPVFNPDDPDHTTAVFALFAADLLTLYVLRPGYDVEQMEGHRLLRPGSASADWDSRCDWQIADECDDYATMYTRAACGNYLLLFATCWGCSNALWLPATAPGQQ